LPADENFHVSATNIYNQNIHDLADPPNGSALERDHVHEIVPRLDKGLGSFILKLGSHLIDMDAGLGELIRDFFAIATVCGRDGVYCAMIGQSFHFKPIRSGVHVTSVIPQPDRRLT
jgi:hypothetical protein